MVAAKEENIEEEVSQKGGSFFKWVVLLMLFFLIAGSGGFFAWYKFFREPTQIKVTEKKETKKIEDTLGIIFPLETFIVNLSEDTGKRYLKTTLELELPDLGSKEEVEKRKAQIRDNLLVLLSSKSFSDINTIKGKYKLKDEIITRLNAILVNGKVKQVYFTEFVIQ
ncbi:MAG TPA: flagellar basal body-associated FliL family protein [Nitrospinota bacterium]|nr:flagellar basal body-associated FliL family protein [Nitrospinota bacterium]